MDTSKEYIVDLLDSELSDKKFNYSENDSFFANIGGLISRGQIETEVSCTSATSSFVRFSIHSEGKVIVPCDRCLSDLELRINTNDELLVKLGDDYSDDGDCVTVPREDGEIDLSQYIYEFIALGMPIKRVHEPGECDKAMIQRLSEYQTISRDGQEVPEDMDGLTDVNGDDEVRSEQTDEIIDKRWEALRKFKNNNN